MPHSSHCETDISSVILTDEKKSEIIDLIVNLAKINSGTGNESGLEQIRHFCAPHLEEAGFTVTMLPHHILLAERKGSRKPAVFILGHMDTVFEASHPFQKVWIDGDYLRGPGVGDMKGGIALVISALKELNSLGSLNDRTVTVLFNADEERGSNGSRVYIEEYAVHHDLALVFEGGKRVDDKTTYVLDRKGAGHAQFTVKGVASHAGLEYEKGVNALEEMAYKIIEIQKLTNSMAGSTVSVTGHVEVRDARRNVIPGWVRFNVDFRFTSKEEADRLICEFSRIAATSHVKNIKTGESAETEFQCFISRPPMLPDPTSLKYASYLQSLSEKIGHPMISRTRGGGSDGCFTSAAGVPTLDGLGPVGDGWHSEGEYLEISSLWKRYELFLQFWKALYDEAELPPQPSAGAMCR
ncbi:MAG: M20/M25/M40 family metallo-hydrolase [Vulcanimicrobiota bacterium]